VAHCEMKVFMAGFGPHRSRKMDQNQKITLPIAI
jgi:hypothetical protein